MEAAIDTTEQFEENPGKDVLATVSLHVIEALFPVNFKTHLISDLYGAIASLQDVV